MAKKNDKSYFLVYITKRVKHKFLMLFNDYREFNDEYSMTTSDFFNIACKFLLKKYTDLELYEKSTEAFISYSFRRGKRKKNSRTPDDKDKTSLRLVGEENTFSIFGDLCFYFVKKYHSSNFIDENYSKAFFFFDFVEELLLFKKELINYKKIKE